VPVNPAIISKVAEFSDGLPALEIGVGIVRVMLVAGHRDGRRAEHCNSYSNDHERPLHYLLLHPMGHRKPEKVQVPSRSW
jgi:hypothetical protein